MTAVNDPRSTTNASQIAAKASKDAALRGALRAFAGPQARPPVPRPAAPRAPPFLDGVADSHDQRPNATYSVRRSSKTSAAPAIPSSTTHAQSTLRYTGSSSRPATAVVAGRFPQNSALSRHDAAPGKSMGADVRGLAASTPKPTPDALPPAGTVHGTKDYFETLHTENGVYPDSSISRPSKTYLQQMTGSAQPRPHLSVDVGAAVAEAQGLPAEIQSPKPVRPSAGARPLEYYTDGSTDGALVEEEGFSTPVENSVDLSATHVVATDRPAPPPAQHITHKVSVAADSQPSTASHISSAQIMRPPPGPLSASISYSMRPRSAESHLTRSKRGSPHASSGEQAHAHRIDSLANAIVASHLASSRAPSRAGSPGKAMKPSLPRRVTDHPSVLHPGMASYLSKQESRTPSPKKGIRQTMRKPHSPVDSNTELVDKHKRSHFRMRKHPHKHREGDRKRWRDEITETERKRYDGLWAANRDLYISLAAEELRPFGNKLQTDGYVSSLVVRDIWSRSRLPSHVLEEIWELVDLEGIGRLSREAFVVGVWLVDQRLKGRKLPVKVGDSVWHSARGIYGLKMPRIKS